MSDVNQIVDLRSSSDARVVKSPPVDGAIRTDAHIVLHNQMALLRETDVFARARIFGPAKPHSAQHTASMHLNSVSEPHTAMQDDTRFQQHIIASDDVAFNNNAGSNLGTTSNLRGRRDYG